MKNELTERQQAILDFIRRQIERGMPPTRADIAEAFGFASRSAAEQHLRALADKGAIALNEGAARGIRLLGAREPKRAGVARRSEKLPLIGRVAAGQPILAAEHVEDELTVDPDLFRPRADYLLRVQGDSMIEAGIQHGDCLAVHRQASADTGAIVVARIDDEVTVKRLSLRQGRPLLLAANAAYAPILVKPGQQFAIEGLAVGVLRRTLS